MEKLLGERMPIFTFSILANIISEIIQLVFATLGIVAFIKYIREKN